MRALAKEGHRHVVLVSVSFVNKHVETLHEMDVELGQDLVPKVGTSTRAAALTGDSLCQQPAVAPFCGQHQNIPEVLQY